ncbi:GHMP kinase [Candidatus Sumerlaeota bacterium]|nr:GHMP kinase [Candidatus Sumerlaeota bacterium]
MLIRTHAFARAGLVGNPSDGYFGKTIAIIVKNFRCRVTLYESPRLVILAGHRDKLDFDSMDDLVAFVEESGYYGATRLIKATIKKFYDYCRGHGIALEPKNFTIEYDTNIPLRVGLAGSSAIVTAAMRALMQFYGVEIPMPLLPSLILSAETDELKITAGLQDRVVQVYEGCVYMDFRRELLESAGYGHYEPIDPSQLPPLFVAYHDALSEGTEVAHSPVRERWLAGETMVIETMNRIASLAERARELLVEKRPFDIGPLLDENFELRARLYQISPGNRELVERAWREGAHAHLAGSGGAIVGVCRDDAVFDRLAHSYAQMGARILKPIIQ